MSSTTVPGSPQNNNKQTNPTQTENLKLICQLGIAKPSITSNSKVPKNPKGAGFIIWNSLQTPIKFGYHYDPNTTDTEAFLMVMDEALNFIPMETSHLILESDDQKSLQHLCTLLKDFKFPKIEAFLIPPATNYKTIGLAKMALESSSSKIFASDTQFPIEIQPPNLTTTANTLVFSRTLSVTPAINPVASQNPSVNQNHAKPSNKHQLPYTKKVIQQLVLRKNLLTALQQPPSESKTEAAIEMVALFHDPYQRLENFPSSSRIFEPNLSSAPNGSIKWEPMEQAIECLERGDYKGAARYSSSSPPASLVQAMPKLLELFPEKPYSSDEIFTNTNVPHFQAAEIMKVLFQMSKKRKGTGLSYITAKHIHNLASEVQEFKTAIEIVVNGIVDGSLIDDTRISKLAIMRGICLSKPAPTDNPLKTGIRPIAVSETLVTLCAKMLMPSIKNEVLNHLDDLDFGFAKPGGCECIIHSIQSIYLERVKRNDESEEFVLLQTDFKNAFGTADRKQLLTIAKKICPAIIPFLKFRYQYAAYKFQDDSGHVWIKPDCGIAQGCPISPVIFQLLMNHILADLRKQSPLLFSFLDDINAVFTSIPQAIQMLRQIKTESMKYGLELNLSKCYLFYSKKKEINPCDFPDFPELSQIKLSNEGAFVLGSFVGKEQFIRNGLNQRSTEFIKDRVDSFIQMCQFSESNQYLKKKRNSLVQKKVQMVRFCIANCFTYSLRTSFPGITKSYALKVDCGVISSFIRAITRNLTEQPEKIQLMQQLLDPVQEITNNINFGAIFWKQGGVGLSSAYFNCTNAYLSSLSLCAPTIAKIWNIAFPNNPPTSMESAFRIQGFVEKIKQLKTSRDDYLEESARKKGNVFTADEDMFPLETSALNNQGTGRRISNQLKTIMDFHHSNTMLNNIKQQWEISRNENDFSMQRAMAYCNPWARAWIHANLQNPNNILPDECARDEYDKLAQFDILHPSEQCRWCNKTTITTPFKDHVVSCTHRYLNRSNGIMVQKGFIEVLRLFERVRLGEPKLLESVWFDYVDEEDTTQYLADCLSFHQIAGHDVHLDVAFSGTFHKTNKARNPEFPMESLNQIQTRKTKTYKKRLNYPENCLVFIALDSCGGMGPMGIQYMQEAKESLQDKRRLSPERRSLTDEGYDIPFWEWQRAKVSLSLTICKANYEYTRVCREGRLKNGLTKQQASEKAKEAKILKQALKQNQIQQIMNLCLDDGILQQLYPETNQIEPITGMELDENQEEGLLLSEQLRHLLPREIIDDVMMEDIYFLDSM